MLGSNLQTYQHSRWGLKFLLLCVSEERSKRPTERQEKHNYTDVLQTHEAYLSPYSTVCVCSLGMDVGERCASKKKRLCKCTCREPVCRKTTRTQEHCICVDTGERNLCVWSDYTREKPKAGETGRSWGEIKVVLFVVHLFAYIWAFELNKRICWPVTHRSFQKLHFVLYFANVLYKPYGDD